MFGRILNTPLPIVMITSDIKTSSQHTLVRLHLIFGIILFFWFNHFTLIQIDLCKNQILGLKKRNLLGLPILMVYYISLRFCTCYPYRCLQSSSLVCFVPLNKNEKSSFSEHVDSKPFLTDSEKNPFPQTLSKALIRGTCKISENINSLCLSWSS